MDGVHQHILNVRQVTCSVGDRATLDGRLDEAQPKQVRKSQREGALPLLVSHDYMMGRQSENLVGLCNLKKK